MRHRAQQLGAVGFLVLGLLFLAAGIMTAPLKAKETSLAPVVDAVPRSVPMAHVFVAQPVIAASTESFDIPL
jgi:hypothetical protein